MTIYNRYSGRIILEKELETLFNANLRSANLRSANLRSANLRSANLRSANLRSANLRSANLRSANLRSANLRSANLHSANLRSANLRSANLRSANLRSANLSLEQLLSANTADIKAHLFYILLYAKKEAPALLDALKNGRVDGSVYSGECACLVGTIANIRQCNYLDMTDIKPDGGSPAERWFLAIRKGDTPENNPVCKITVEWVEEFLELNQ